MNEVISSILEAEKEAENIVHEAQIKAKNNILSVDTECDNIKADAITAFKSKRKSVLFDAEKEAESVYQKVLSDGEKNACILKDKASPNIDNAAEAVIKEIMK